jgi:hypothetical protein
MQKHFRVHPKKKPTNSSDSSVLDELVRNRTSDMRMLLHDGQKWVLSKIENMCCTGIKGDSGAKGDKGERGEKGNRGLPGEQGTQGPIGQRGTQGATGATGLGIMYNNNTVLLGSHQEKPNIVVGFRSEDKDNDGLANIFIGNETGRKVTGRQNTYIGDHACAGTGSRGSYNLFIGSEAGFWNKDGFSNTFLGTVSGANNSDGVKNTFVGQSAGHGCTSGSSNIFIGNMAGISDTTGSNNICVGDGADTKGENARNQIVIGSNVVSKGNNTLTFPNNLRSFPNNVEVNFSDSNGGCLYPVSSSIRWKTNVRNIENVIDTEKIYNLRPVVYTSMGNSTDKIGLIAEEVDPYLSIIVPKDSEGNPASIQYSLLSILLLSEIQKIRKELDLISK